MGDLGLLLEESIIESEYFYNKKLEKLLKIRLEKMKKNPNSYEYKFQLGEAYIWNKEYNKALEILGELYEKSPEDIGITEYILECLSKLKKDELDFNWITQPKILKLSEETLEMCFEYLKKERKIKGIFDVYQELLLTGHLKFKEEDLYNRLISDKRFEVLIDENLLAFSKIKIA